MHHFFLNTIGWNTMTMGGLANLNRATILGSLRGLLNAAHVKYLILLDSICVNAIRSMPSAILQTPQADHEDYMAGEGVGSCR